ncbi:hypothetical protein CEP52_004023 [Fusarium oligoseptatum]|uniref:Uncharacterized protein n=1 Tax=Fusarium oligoseptatum TaxID=2604345 RepID=A0A428U5Q0_9HYPO|nr:hypothetical protein CEP52_004023 [Fusarium oligoseptatum]
MSSPTHSSNTRHSESEEQSDTKASMLNPFIYDTSPLPDRLIMRAMSAATHTVSSTATTTATATATKDKPSNDAFVKDLEKSQEITPKL